MLKFELNTPIDISICTRGKSIKRTIYIGIYKITSPSGQIYIGQSVNLENRFAVYKNLIHYNNKEKKHQRKLYNSFKKYGAIKHSFEIIHLCQKEELNTLEIHYFKLHAQSNNRPALNLREGGGSQGALSHETKKRIGTANSGKLFCDYKEFENWVRTNELTKGCKTEAAWRQLKGKLPINIPKAPENLYKNKGWQGWGALFLTGNKNKEEFLNYEEAKKIIQKFVSTNEITSTNWKQYVTKLPFGVPRNPPQYYKKHDAWKDWGDFLGTGNKHKSAFISYEEAKKFAQATKIKTSVEWSKRTFELPKNIPRDPEVYYKKQNIWKGWGDFLGTDNIANQNKKKVIYDYKKFVKWVKTCELILSQDIKSATNLRNQWQKKEHTNTLPYYIPKAPRHAYKNKGWKGWGYLLGEITL